MTARRNASLLALERELQKWEGVDHEFTSSKRHTVLVLKRGGVRRKVFFSSTVTCPRGPLNAVSTTRKLLKELGAEKKY